MFPRILLIIGLLTSINLFGQYQFEAQKFTFEASGTFNVSEVKEDFFPQVVNLEAPHPDGQSYRDYLENLKSKMSSPGEVTPYKKTASVEVPELGMGFRANLSRGTPNDNDVAISNDGWLISVVNSSVYMRNINAVDTFTEVSLETFSVSLGSYTNAFDPKVRYDPIEDRFVLLFLNGFSSGQNSIVVAFSQTNNPSEGWNLYEIPGSPFGAGTWSDFPMFALTEDDFFLTINLIQDGVSWEAGFTETLVWQIDKASAYAGEEIETKLWAQTNLDGLPIRNAIPIQGGSGLAGPNLFLLSNRNFDVENDTIFLMEITGNTFDDNATFSVEVLESPLVYGAPPNARQSATRTLQTNDARVLGAYYENDRIHFVGMTNVPEVNIPGIYHGTITEPGFSNQLEATILSDTLDLGYPNLAFSGTFPEDDQFILIFSFAAPLVKPGHGAILYNFGDYSDMVVVKEGNKHIGPNVLTAAPQRWGDYSGAQPRYNQLGTVWTSGTYGLDLNTLSHPGSTWVGELSSTVENAVGIEEVKQTSGLNATNVYPNPVQDRVHLDFEIDKSQELTFQLSSNQGQVVKTLFHDKVKEGKNQFSFSVHSLPSGLYILNILDEADYTIISKQIVVQ